MSAEYSVDEVEAMIKRLTGWNAAEEAAELLHWAANLIKADEGAVPVAWLCDTNDGSNCDAVVSMHARDTYASAGRTITPLYTHPLRSGVVSDEDAHVALERFTALRGESPINAMRAVLESYERNRK